MARKWTKEDVIEFYGYMDWEGGFWGLIGKGVDDSEVPPELLDIIQEATKLNRKVDKALQSLQDKYDFQY